MTISKAISYLSQMYLPQFDDEEKQALTMAISALNRQDWEDNREIVLVDDKTKPCKFGFTYCDNRYSWHCSVCKQGSYFERIDNCAEVYSNGNVAQDR